MSKTETKPYPPAAMLLAQDAITKYKSLIGQIRRCEKQARLQLERLEMLYKLLEETPEVGIDPYDPFNEGFIKVTDPQRVFWGRICLPGGFRDERKKQTPRCKKLCEFVADCPTRKEKILKYLAHDNERRSRLERIEGFEPSLLTFEEAERRLEAAFVIEDHSEHRCFHQEAFGDQCLCTKKAPVENDQPDSAGGR